jgi:hypothetical protein
MCSRIDSTSSICTSGLKRAQILAAIMNATSKIRIGKTVPEVEIISESEARLLIIEKIVKEGKPDLYFFFGWQGEKRLKVDLTDEASLAQSLGYYNNGKSAHLAKLAVDILRITYDPCHPDIIAHQNSESR